MSLREKLIVLRDKAGISQMTLAHQLGVSRQAVSRWESGDATPSMDKLKALAKIYNVSLDWLCSDASNTGNSAQAENLEKYDSESDNKPHTEEKTKNKKLVLEIGIFAIVFALLLMYVWSKKVNLLPGETKQIGELAEEDVSEASESGFEFDWQED